MKKKVPRSTPGTASSDICSECGGPCKHDNYATLVLLRQELDDMCHTPTIVDVLFSNHYQNGIAAEETERIDCGLPVTEGAAEDDCKVMHLNDIGVKPSSSGGAKEVGVHHMHRQEEPSLLNIQSLQECIAILLTYEEGDPASTSNEHSIDYSAEKSLKTKKDKLTHTNGRVNRTFDFVAERMATSPDIKILHNHLLRSFF